MKFFVCEHCGNVICFATDQGVPVVCCGEKMKELVPGTVEASLEKHIPVVDAERGRVLVQVGEAEHPMLDEHWTEWIVLETGNGWQLRKLHPGDKPAAEFALTPEDEIVAVYAYCNIHGLWRA